MQHHSSLPGLFWLTFMFIVLGLFIGPSVYSSSPFVDLAGERQLAGN